MCAHNCMHATFMDVIALWCCMFEFHGICSVSCMIVIWCVMYCWSISVTHSITSFVGTVIATTWTSLVYLWFILYVCYWYWCGFNITIMHSMCISVCAISCAILVVPWVMTTWYVYRCVVIISQTHDMCSLVHKFSTTHFMFTVCLSLLQHIMNTQYV